MYIEVQYVTVTQFLKTSLQLLPSSYEVTNSMEHSP